MRTEIQVTAIMVMLAVVLAAFSSCDKLKEIPASVSVVILDEQGNAKGFVSVEMWREGVTDEPAYKVNASENGSAFFEKITAATYELKVLNVQGKEYPVKEFSTKGSIGLVHDKANTIRVSPGRTLQATIVIDAMAFREVEKPW